MVLNKKVVHIFYEMARLLEILGENPFRVRAYEKAAMRIESLTEDLSSYIEQDRLEEIPGIGKDLASKIKEIASTGTLSQYEELKKKVPSGVVEMLRIPGLGPKKIKIIYEKLGIENIDALEEAAKRGRLRGLPGFGVKTEENILRGIEFLRKNKEKVALGWALPIAKDLCDWLKRCEFVKKVDVVGSIRRFKEVVHDIDILAVGEQVDKIMEHFVSYPDLEQVLAKGEKKSSIMVSGLQVDLRVFDENSYGSALIYFTGSKEHNIKLRQVCIDRGYKLNEYGLFKGDKFLAGRTEEEVYSALSMQWIDPEIREDSGEIELALKKQLPKLIKPASIVGDLHIHTIYSDGTDSIEQMVKTAERLGYKYIAITDHSVSLSVARGLSRERILAQIEEIKSLNKRYPKVKILTGMEVDILADGGLDCPEDILELLDVVIVAVHSRFKMTEQDMTNRIIKAISHPEVNIFAHPTGRLLGERDGYPVDTERIIESAKKYKVALELNSSPFRLDINASVCRIAKDYGVKIAINTDAHSTDQLGYMFLGVGTARRGWLEEKDVINTMELPELLRFLKKQ